MPPTSIDAAGFDIFKRLLITDFVTYRDQAFKILAIIILLIPDLES
ncbi:MAG: hypothetical protein AAGI25_12295 [Bacteroidota bacterium]